MTNKENKIPIKGYATFHPLKHCVVGKGFEVDWFKDLSIAKNDKIMSPLQRIAEETEEDYQKLVTILEQAGIKTYRTKLDMSRYSSLHDIPKPPTVPRDFFAVIGEKIYANLTGMPGYNNFLKDIKKENIQFIEKGANISTCSIARVGKDLWWDCVVDEGSQNSGIPKGAIRQKYLDQWKDEGYRVHVSEKGYHTDGSFCIVKPGCIISLPHEHDYDKEFPGWDVLSVPEQGSRKMYSWFEMKNKVGGRWWLKGEEHNDQLIEFVNTWLNDWVGYVEETVFDVNQLSIDENTIICNNYDKEVFAHFKKHKVEPIIFNFRHRWFWDGGVHCITQDLYREGTQEDYFG
jgi:N-dimethylarginine dimethylaminohydrolase